MVQNDCKYLWDVSRIVKCLQGVLEVNHMAHVGVYEGNIWI